MKIGIPDAVISLLGGILDLGLNITLMCVDSELTAWNIPDIIVSVASCLLRMSGCLTGLTELAIDFVEIPGEAVVPAILALSYALISSSLSELMFLGKVAMFGISLRPDQ